MNERDAIRMALSNPRLARMLGDAFDQGRMSVYSRSDRGKPMRFVVARSSDLEMPIDGSITAKCELCREVCAVAPEMQGLLAAHVGPTELLCTHCLVQEMNAAPTRV